MECGVRFLKLGIIFILFISAESVANEPKSGLRLAGIHAICGSTEEVFEHVAQSEQTLTWSKVEMDSHVVSLWENKNKESFTLIKTEASGAISCIVAMNESDDIIL